MTTVPILAEIRHFFLKLTPQNMDISWLQWNFLEQTAASGYEIFPTFRQITPSHLYNSNSSGRLVISFGATKSPAHPVDGEGISCPNVVKFSQPDVAACLRKFHCGISEQLRRYLIGNPWPKHHKEDPSTDGRITSNRTLAKWRSKIGQLASRIKRNGRRRSLRRPSASTIKESSAPGRRRIRR